jgi:hypothetical protein
VTRVAQGLGNVVRVDPRSERVAVVPQTGVIGVGFGSLRAESCDYVTRFAVPMMWVLT